MANATIGPVTGVQTGMFTVNISFDASIRGLDETDVNLRSLTENGITGVDFTIVGTEPNANFNLAFTLPSNKEGSFEISITGMVTPQGSSTPEAVMANTVVVFYDTTANVTATFGTVEYRDDGVIAVPVNFAENVVVPSKTVFRVTRVENDDSDLSGIEYIILGEDTAWELVFTVLPDRRGRFKISAVGDVLKVSSGIFDNVVATPITVEFDTSVPRLKDYDIPDSYTAGEIFDVILQLDTDATVSPAPTGGTFLDHFIFEGAHLGTPNLYRKTDHVYPTLPIAETLPAEWTQADMTTEEATIYLLRWSPVIGSPEGIFNLTVREGAFRGPVS